jgi:hypothetical protein
MSTRRVFLDTEWTAVPWSSSADLLWIALSDEAGRKWCGICSEAKVDPAYEKYVSDLMQLVGDDIPRLARHQLRAAVLEFCKEVTEFWSWIPTQEGFAAWSKLGESAATVYRQCRDIDMQMLRSLVSPWPPGWPSDLNDLNQAATLSGAALPVRAKNHLHPLVHAEWNRQLFSHIQHARSNGAA